MKYFLGVDVGTGSVRAALVQSDGKIVTTATQNIQIWNPEPDFYEQSSQDIWKAVIHTVQTVVKDGNVKKDDIGGFGFDATCSLVVMDTQGKPLSVSPTGNSECNIVMWMDHRAGKQADFINSTNHDVLRYTGGAISLEMETPKLLWLKQNMKEKCWDKAGHFFDLCDFLTWRATGCLTRSLCALVSKWTYVSDGKGGGGFSEDYFRLIGLEDLIENNFQKIGSDVKPQGIPCGAGLSAEAARELGLNTGMPVAISMVDAHSGSLGCLGCTAELPGLELPPLNARIAMICGTSTCHMAVNESAIFVPGVWGPMGSSIVPGLWSTEAGQSAAGKLIDFVVETHVSYLSAVELAKRRNQHVYEYLEDVLKEEAAKQGLGSVSGLTKEFHVWPDFHGNRSPLADHTSKGMISGLTLRSDVGGLALLYLATVQALAYGTRHIIEEMKKCGHVTSIIYICGGLRKNRLYIQTHADVTGFPVILPDEKESVLLGGAILGATASGTYSSVQEAMACMGGKGKAIMPNMQELEYHKKKYQVFLSMYKHQMEYRAVMDS